MDDSREAAKLLELKQEKLETEERLLEVIVGQKEEEVREKTRDDREKAVALLKRKKEEEIVRRRIKVEMQKRRNSMNKMRAERAAHLSRLQQEEDGLQQARQRAATAASEVKRLLEADVERRENRVREKAKEEVEIRTELLKRESEERTRMERLLDEAMLRGARREAITAELAALQSSIQQEEKALEQAKANFEAKRRARIDATREADEHPRSLSIRYSRACSICPAANPRKRAVMVTCGHIVCAPCADQMAVGRRVFACPFCRKDTSYVKIFEDEEYNDGRGRKRKLSEENEGGSEKNQKTQRAH